MAWMYLWQELRTRRRGTLQVAGTIAVAIWLIVTVQGLSGALLRAVEAPFRASGPHMTVQRAGAPPTRFEGAVAPATHGPISRQEVSAVGAPAGVKSIREAVLLWGVEPGRLSPVLGIDQVGNQPVGSDSVLISSRLAAGGQANTSGELLLGGKSFKVSGSFAEGSVPAGAPLYVISLVSARALLSGQENWEADAANLLLVEAQPGQAGNLLATIPPTLGDTRPRDPDGDVDANAVQRRGERQVTVTSAEQLRMGAGGVFGLVSRFALLVTAVLGVVSFLLVLKLFAATIAERRAEAGALKAVGWTTSNLVLRYTALYAVQGLLGGVAGTAAAGVTLLLLSGGTVSLPSPGGTEVAQPGMPAAIPTAVTAVLAPRLSWGLSVGAVAAALLAAALAALVFAGRLRKIKPAEVLR